eukprot:s103_g54.t1
MTTAMSFRANAPGTTSLPCALGSALGSNDVQLVVGVSADHNSLQHVDADESGLCQSNFSAAGSFDLAHDHGNQSHRAELFVETLPGPTVADSFDGLQGSTLEDSDAGSSWQSVSQRHFGSPGVSDSLRQGLHDFLDDNGSEPMPGHEGDDRNIDWLLDLGPDGKDERVLNTERLDDDRQVPGLVRAGVRPGFGVDSSSWTLEVDQPKFFWETDPFLSTVFGKGDVQGPSFKRPAVDFDLTSQAPDDVMTLLRAPKQVRVACLCEQVIKHVELRDEHDKRQSVISNWSSIVCINLDAFTVGDAIVAGGGSLTHAVVEDSLKACFARKATSTLSKRFYALNRFVNYCCRNGLQFFPLREHVVFTYLQSLVQDERTSASAGRSFLEACRFARGLLGLRGDLADLGTARVDGVAVELGKRAGPIRQASPLQVSQVIALEKLVATTIDLKDRVLLGAMLILLYGCGRFSDGQRAVNIILDVKRDDFNPTALDCPGFLELQILGNKGARSDVLRRTYLPLVAPVYSLGNVDWFRSWLQAREALGLEISGKLNSPLMCRFGVDGKPLAQEVTSSECGKLLRMALKLGDDTDAAIRSHSLKATALSWTGKHGVSLETRRLLGHHLDANAKSAETYNRDSMGPAIEKLIETLQAIKRGVFIPDATRSGRFVAEGRPPVEASETGEADEQSSDSDSSYMPDTDDSDSDDDHNFVPAESGLLWHLVVPELLPGFIDVPDSYSVFRNNVSGVQHLKPNGSIKFLCGRRECDRHLSLSCAAMSSYAESNASFKHRAQQIQLTDDHVQALYDNDIRCFNHLAFAVNGQPGQLDQERFQNLVDMICPRGATIGVQAGLKQLAYESLTVAVAAIKQRIETPDETARKLPAQEKDQRLKVMRDKITGFEIKGDYEPAHCVIDAFAGSLMKVHCGISH